MSLHPAEAARFLSDIPQDGLTTVLQRMADDGHREIPTT